MIEKVISGGQVGVDIAALRAAKKLGIATGGWMPRGYKNYLGSQRWMGREFGIQEHPSLAYPPRTRCNVRDSHGTLRLATDFSTAGERCTLRAILEFDRPYYDVPLPIRRLDAHLRVAEWLGVTSIQILNVAGNARPEIERPVEDFLLKVFACVNQT